MTATTREKDLQTFLNACGAGSAKRIKLADDASFRTYDRVQMENLSRVLMNAPPDFEDTRPFAVLSDFLKEQGFSVPEVLARDYKNGFLLLEDLGDNTFNRVLRENRKMETDLYAASIDVLLALHQIDPPEKLPVTKTETFTVPAYTKSLLFEELFLFTDWYLPVLFGSPAGKARHTLEQLFKPLFETLKRDDHVFVLRDYHADNLMWLPEREGIGKVGVLDFQDAVIGHPAYDLVSLLQDARRKFSPDLEKAMIARYLEGMARKGRSFDKGDFMQAYEILGAQRNMKIIGIFTRLWKRDGKKKYPAMIPHVWSLLEENLAHPALGEVKAFLQKTVPPNKRKKNPAG